MDNKGVVLLKREFPAVFKTAWTKVTIFTTSWSAFRCAGMFPFCPNAIDPNRLYPVQIAAPFTPRNISVPFADVKTKYEVVSAFA